SSQTSIRAGSAARRGGGSGNAETRAGPFFFGVQPDDGRGDTDAQRRAEGRSGQRRERGRSSGARHGGDYTGSSGGAGRRIGADRKLWRYQNARRRGNAKPGGRRAPESRAG